MRASLGAPELIPLAKLPLAALLASEHCRYYARSVLDEASASAELCNGMFGRWGVVLWFVATAAFRPHGTGTTSLPLVSHWQRANPSLKRRTQTPPLSHPTPSFLLASLGESRPQHLRALQASLARRNTRNRLSRPVRQRRPAAQIVQTATQTAQTVAQTARAQVHHVR
ncbi:hypothetical protein K458DRAFT_52033 [Lentithecium fluviatile CBS 122367]|uniref:Uncharacterized protein n=1 Tax=Lentithecium fluviatile CBS 122367 TaxID=1168545 RepID=A0A6G1IYL5_9PLEO|nr:hypothetical protein K458DRAFT_52033 [Lentithecium fluviatile CBS 122367]